MFKFAENIVKEWNEIHIEERDTLSTIFKGVLFVTVVIIIGGIAFADVQAIEERRQAKTQTKTSCTDTKQSIKFRGDMYKVYNCSGTELRRD